MKHNDKLIRVYSGNEVNVNLLKGRLEILGIYAAIQNDSNDSFLRGVPAAVDLYILQSDFTKAKAIIKEFVEKN